MINCFEQSAPPSIHDVYRGLPIGPGGVETFIYRDRDPHKSDPVNFPWRSVKLTLRRAFSQMCDVINTWRSTAVSSHDRPLRP